MKRFIRNIFIFISPFLLLIISILPFEYALKETGELDSVVFSAKRQQQDNSILVGNAYNQQDGMLKKTNVNYYQPEVVALGSSRVQGIRQDYINRSFYNCSSGASSKFDSYVNFIKNMNYTPKVIITCIDPWGFNSEWNSSQKKIDSFIEIKESNINNKTFIKDAIKDWFNGKWSFTQLGTDTNNIGFWATFKNTGYRVDGSYYYGDMYLNEYEDRFDDTLKRVEKGISKFEYGEDIDERAVEKLDEFLKYCKDKEIVVVAYVAPLAPVVYDAMLESGKYDYLDKINPVCENVFDKYGYEFYDYMDPVSLNLDNEHFVDGFHTGEVAYGIILKDILEQDSILKEYVDEEKLDDLLENAYSDMCFEKPD